MARRRQLNKNLVAVLTIAGIILSVAIVAVGTLQVAKKDPQLYVTEAQAVEEQDLQQAAQLYVKAYEVDKEVKYLTEAAGCMYELGEISRAFSLLIRAHAEQPEDVAALNTLLEYLWELKYYQPTNTWPMMRDYAETILRVAPDHMLGLVCQAAALTGLAEEDPENARRAEESLQRAIEIEETNPRVAVLRAQRLFAQIEQLRADQARGAAPRDAEEQTDELYEQLHAVLQAALNDHPGEWELAALYAQALHDDGNTDASRGVLERALAAAPDNVDLRLSLGRYRMSDAARERDQLSSEQLETLLKLARELITTALETDPALFEGYVDLARLTLLQGRVRELEGPEWARQHQAALDIYRNALQDTVDLKSIRAMLGVGQKVRMLHEAFFAAVNYFAEFDDPENRAAALEYARFFQDDVATEFPMTFLAPLMRGELTLLKDNRELGPDDYREAIHAFVQAEERSRTENRRYNRRACERLAELYRRVDEHGAALEYLERTITSYAEDGLQPPARLWFNRLVLLNLLKRHQEALDLAEQLRRRHPEERAVRDSLITALLGLGRKEEAQRLLAATPTDSAGGLLKQAWLAASTEDYATAEELLRNMLDKQPGDIKAIRLYAHVMIAGDRRTEGREYLSALIKRLGPEEQQRFGHVVRGLEVVLSTPDPEQRKAKLLEIVQSISDPEQWATELYNFYVTQRPPMYEEALPFLNELEKMQEGERGHEMVVEQQFALRLLLKQFDEAERYAAKLGELNADRADGAVYRGRLALARNEPELALREFYSAARYLPGNSALNVFIARALLAASPPRFEEALDPLEKALKANPRHFLANKVMFAVLDELGRREEGHPYLETAASVQPNDPYVKEQEQIWAEEENPREGIARRETLRQSEPDNVDNLARLAELYAREEVADDARAEECLQAAIATDPAHRRAARVAADFYASRKKREAGEQFMRKHLATLQEAGRVEGQVLLARFFEEGGDPGAAHEAFLACDKLVDEQIVDPDRQRWARAAVGFELIEFYRRNARPEEMVAAARRVLTLLEPDEPSRMQRARLVVAEGLLELKRHGEAEQELERYLQDYPDEPRGLTTKAQLLIARNEPQTLLEAHELLGRILQDYPENTVCLLLRGSVSAELGRYDGARRDLLKVKRLVPEGLDLAHRRNLAKLYETQQQFELAEAEWRELAALRPDSREFPLRLIRLYFSLGDIAKAQQVATEHMSQHPNDAFWPYQLAYLMMQRDEYSAAAGYLKTAVELSEFSEPAFIAEWLRALVHAQRADEALRIFGRLPAEQMTPMIRVNAAEAYLVQNQLEAARQFILAAALQAADESLPQLANVCGRVVEMTSVAKTVELLRRLLRESSAAPERETRLQIMLASSLVEVGLPADAVKLLEPVLASAARGSNERIGALLAHARARELLGDSRGMIEAYQEVLTQDVNNAQALNNMAFALADRFERFKDALPYAERARQIAGNRVDVLDTVGWVYFLNERYPQAESILREALRLGPRSLPARFHLGQVYQKLGRISEARAAFGRVVEQARKDENAEFEKKATEALNSLK